MLKLELIYCLDVHVDFNIFNICLDNNNMTTQVSLIIPSYLNIKQKDFTLNLMSIVEYSIILHIKIDIDWVFITLVFDTLKFKSKISTNIPAGYTLLKSSSN